MSQNELENNNSKQLKQEIIEQIEGYKYPLNTPYGKILSISSDLYSNGRSLKIIEQNISQFIRPYINSLGNQRKQQIQNRLRMNILKELNLSEKEYKCIAFSKRNEMDCFSNIYNMYVDKIKQQQTNNKINVYIQNNQSYKNILPWLVNNEYVRIITLDSGDQNNIQISSISKTVQSHILESSYHIIQVNSYADHTFLNLNSIANQIQALKNEYPDQIFISILDATYLIQQNQQKDQLSFFDFITIQSNNLIGGSLAANLLVVKKEIINGQDEQNISLFEFDIDAEQKIDTEQIMRISQIIEFYKIKNISNLMEESQNSKLFFDEINKVNQQLQQQSVLTKIDLGDINNIGPTKFGRYEILLYQEGAEQFIDDESNKLGNGRPVMLAKYLSQFLFDFFGIQTKLNNQLKSDNDFYISDIEPYYIKKYGLTQEEGFKELQSSRITIDIHFLLTQEEVIYIVQALKIIAQYGNKLMKYYNNNNDQLFPKLYTPPSYDLSLQACSQFQQGSQKELEFKTEQLNEQLQLASKVFKNPDNYFSLQNTWSEDKSIIYLNNYPEIIPVKVKQLSSKNSIQSYSSINQDNSSLTKINVIDDQQVQEVRKLLKSINQNESPKKKEDGDTQDQNKIIQELQLKINKLQEDNQEVGEEKIKQIRKEIKSELEKEMQNRLQLEKDYQFDIAIKVKEKRQKNLRMIFNFYTNLLDVLQDKKDSERDNNNQPQKKYKGKNDKYRDNSIEKPKCLAMNKFFKFSDDFSLINEELDIKTLYQIFQKITNQYGDITFENFQILLEKMAIVYFQKNDQLFTSFDKIEQLFRHIGIDDIKLFKPKLKEEGLANFSFIFHDKYKLFHQAHLIPNHSDSNLNKPYLIQNNSNNNNSISSYVNKNSLYSNNSYLNQYSLNNQQNNQQNNMNQQSMNNNSNNMNNYYAHYNNNNLLNQNPSPIKNNNTNNNIKKCDVNWEQDALNLNPKQMYNDRQISEDDVFSEVALLSNQVNNKERNQSHQPHTNQLARNYTYATPNLRISSQIYQSNKDLPTYNLNSQITQTTNQTNNSPKSPINQNRYEYYKPISYKPNNAKNYVQVQQQSPIQNNSSKYKSSISDEFNLNHDNNYQADQRKQQLMLRAKQIADQEKEKDNKRIKTLTTQSSPINSSGIYSPKYDASNIYQNLPLNKVYKKDHSNSQLSPHYNEQQSQINQNYKNQNSQRK